ncbi:MAG TPA: DUF3455 domain-containing protein [Polyangia bacterium]|jgi:hypothetical protein
MMIDQGNGTVGKAGIAIVVLGTWISWAPSAAAAPAGPQPPASVPAALRVPAGARPIAKFHATGAQVYKCAATDGKYGWALARPDATLHDASGAAVGTHTAGPTWTSKDGSAVVAAKIEQAPAPTPGAVAWLLLRAISTSGSGLFSAVTFVQRIDTQGGTPPATGCDAPHVGTETRASYSADYYFYAGGAAAKKTSPH